MRSVCASVRHDEPTPSSSPATRKLSDRKSVIFDLEAVARHLRALHPVKTAEHVGAAIGVPSETVRQWLRGASRPNCDATLALIGVYGLELLAVAMPFLPQPLRDALIAERRRAASEEMRRLGERLEGLNHDATNARRAAPGLGGALGGFDRADAGVLRRRLAGAAGR